MRLSTFIGTCALTWVFTGCSSVTSVVPVGDESVYLEPGEWEGMWAHDSERNGELSVQTLRVKVVDAASGILEACDPSDCTTMLRITMRQHRQKDIRTLFVNAQEKVDGDYLWSKYRRIGNALILYLPDVDKFKELVDKGTLAGQVSGDSSVTVRLGPLAKDQLDRISIDQDRRLFDYELPVDETQRFPGLYRMSPVLAEGGGRCPSQANQEVGVKESGDTPALRYTIIDLGAPAMASGQDSTAAINNIGQVVGSSTTSDGRSQAFIWEGGVTTVISAPDMNSSSAAGVNNRGQVIGAIFNTEDPREGPLKAFMWTRSAGITELGTLGGIASRASAISDNGEIVGTSKTVQGYNHAFKWKFGTGMADLCTLGGRESAAKSINAIGQVVGWSEITWGDMKERRAFLWDNGTMIDLSSLPGVKASGWSKLTEAKRINDGGQIIGFGIREGRSHSFLLAPIPLSTPGH